jgi:hypothetical protein
MTFGAPAVEGEFPELRAPETPVDLGPVSPELAMVDPELRRRLIAMEAARPLRPTRTRPTAAGPGHSQETWVSGVDMKGVSLALGALVAVLAVAAVIGDTFPAGRADPGAAAPPPTTTRPAHVVQLVPTHRAKAPNPGKPPQATRTTPAVEVRRFAWVPAAGADGYLVALYKGNTRVFHALTRSASIDIRVASTGAAAGSVRPGRYEWYVWAVRHGQRQPAALVRSQLDLTAS